jgi:acetylglutamate kinase
VTRVVLKLGGAVAAASLGEVSELRAAGDEVVVVHGAGPQISAELRARGLPVRFVRGRRFTDAETLEVVRASLVEVGAELAAALGPVALQLVGDEIGLAATPIEGLGLVGRPVPSALRSVEDALSRGRIPVVTPVAVGPLNVNADEAATVVAASIDAERVVFVSDVPGVYLRGSVLREIDVDHATALLASGTFEGGIVPKLMAAVQAARAGLTAEIGETVVVA